jgi:hypothetical protein
MPTEVTTDARLGYSSELRRGDGASPETFTLVREVVNIGEVGEESELVDVSHMNSPGGRREFIYGLADGSEMDVECNYVPDDASQQGLIADSKNRVTRNFELECYDTDGVSEGVFLFSCLVMSWKVNLAVDEAQKINFTLKVTGEITGTIIT